MIGYLYLGISLFAGLTKGFCGKKTSSKITGVKDAMLANVVRMIMCVIIGFCTVGVSEGLSQLKVQSSVMWIAAMSGISTSVFVVTWLISVKNSAYMMLDVFLMFGTVIPIGASALLFGENIELNQIIGLVILFFAVYVMCSYNNSIKQKINFSSFAILVLCGVANGISDFSQKLFLNESTTSSGMVFNFYTYVFSGLFLIVFCIILMVRGSQGEDDNQISKLKYVFWYVVVMSVCLFLSSYFKILAAKYLPAYQIYPLNQGLAMIASTIMSVIFFKEKITIKCITGIVIAFIGLIFINVL